LRKNERTLCISYSVKGVCFALIYIDKKEKRITRVMSPLDGVSIPKFSYSCYGGHPEPAEEILAIRQEGLDQRPE
jgi:hypothetical protein